MKRRLITLFLVAGMTGLILSALVSRPVSAHQTIQIGDFNVEIGWLDEPPVVGQRNAIVVNVSPAASGKPAAVDISGLVVSVAYGGETKTFTLQPLSEDSQGQYLAPILPTRPGKYTVKLSGSLGAAAASAEVQPEEVEMADSLQFPHAAEPGAQPDEPPIAVWLAGAALAVSIAALGVALIGARRGQR